MTTPWKRKTALTRRGHESWVKSISNFAAAVAARVTGCRYLRPLCRPARKRRESPADPPGVAAAVPPGLVRPRAPDAGQYVFEIHLPAHQVACNPVRRAAIREATSRFPSLVDLWSSGKPRSTKKWTSEAIPLPRRF